MPKLVYTQDFFSIYDAIDAETCSQIVSLFDSEEGKSQGKTVDADGSETITSYAKNSFDFVLADKGNWSAIFKSIDPIIDQCIGHYISSSPVLRAFKLCSTGYKIQMYPKGEGFFNWHADSLSETTRNRVLAMVCYLNDVEKGGETEFHHQKLKFSPKAGHLLFFPTGWNYMHRGNKPESCGKYIISAFVEVRYNE